MTDLTRRGLVAAGLALGSSPALAAGRGIAPPARAFDLIRLREYLPLGVRVTKFAVDAWLDGGWRQLAVHEGIGAQRLIRLPAPIAPRRVRLRILEAPACPAIAEIALFRQAMPAPVPAVRPSDPTILSTAGWSIVAAPPSGDTRMLLDDDTATVWTVPAPAADRPVTLTVDLGAAVPLAGFSLTPSRHAMADAAPPRGYRAETSLDGRTWQPAAQGEFANIAYALATQRIAFPAVRPARYLRLAFDAVALPARALAIAGIGGFTGKGR